MVSPSILYSWGANSHGQLGTGDYRDRYTPTPITSNEVTLVGGGGGHSVISDGFHVYTCGSNTHGELGRPGDPLHFLPVSFDFTEPITSIACGWDYTLALTKNGTVYAWGSNHYGQLGIGETIKHMSVPASLVYVYFNPRALLARRSTSTCSVSGLRTPSLCGCYWFVTLSALTSDLFRKILFSSVSGEIYTWGSNRRGQLGPLTLDERQQSSKIVPYPTRVKLEDIDPTCSESYPQCSAGANHSAVITSGGSVIIWGDLTYLKTQFAHDMHTKTSHQPGCLRVPRTLFGDVPVVQLVSGWSHLAALTDVGTVFTWGRSHLGQLARQHSNTHLTQYDPTPSLVQFPMLDRQSVCIAQLASGSEHVLAKDVSGQLYVWGWNEHGMCGLLQPDKTCTITSKWTVKQPHPVHLTLSSQSCKYPKITTIGAGYGHSFALGRTDDDDH